LPIVLHPFLDGIGDIHFSAALVLHAEQSEDQIHAASGARVVAHGAMVTVPRILSFGSAEFPNTTGFIPPSIIFEAQKS
jgi:hypothetical protein